MLTLGGIRLCALIHCQRGRRPGVTVNRACRRAEPGSLPELPAPPSAAGDPGAGSDAEGGTRGRVAER
jgi:hypothetical protein